MTTTYSFEQKYAPHRLATETSKPSSQAPPRAFGAVIDQNATTVAGPTAPHDDFFKTPAPQRAGAGAIADAMAGDGRDDGKDDEKDDGKDPASSGKMLAKRLSEVAKTLATPVERKPRAGARRCSVLPGELELHTSILDLNGFDSQGERRRHSMSTPLIVNGGGGRMRVGAAGTAGTATATGGMQQLQCRRGAGGGGGAGAAAGVVTATAAELAELAELRSQRDEMMSILEGYQGTVQKLSDEYSADACAWTSENRLLKTEVERLRRERQQIHEQFTMLYENKYVPLKEHAKNLERAAAEAGTSRARESAAEAAVEALRVELRAKEAAAEAADAALRAAKGEFERKFEACELVLHEREQQISEINERYNNLQRKLRGLMDG